MDIERRTIDAVPEVEFREDSSTGKRLPVLRGYAAVFDSESNNLGGFVEVIDKRAFDRVLSKNPDVYALFNHDRSLILGNTSNGTLKLSVDDYGLRYEAYPDDTSVARDVTTWVQNRTVKASSFAFAVDRAAPNGGESWDKGPRGLRKRTVTDIALLDDVSVVTRPAYDASSVVVSRRAMEMAVGEAYRPNQTMSNAAKRGLKAAANDNQVDPMLISIAERIADRQIVVVEDVSRLSEVMERCAAAKNAGWTGTLPWIEWQLAGGDSGEKWIQRRTEELGIEARKAIADIDFTPPEGVRKEAAKGLEWRREFNRGGTAIGVARARDLSNGAKVSPSTAKRMKAYFDRHEVDKKGQGWSQGEDGFPSPGRVAWALWGGDPGRSWANSLVEQMNAGGERAAAYPEDDDETLKSYEDTDMTERDMALTNAYRDIGTKMGDWTEEDCYYLDEKTGKIMCRSTKDESEGAKSAMSAMDNLNAAPNEGEQREAAVVEEPATTEPPAPLAPTQKQRDDAEAIAAIAALDAVVLETHLHDSSATT
jgi:HK97 family phage prohead protease